MDATISFLLALTVSSIILTAVQASDSNIPPDVVKFLKSNTGLDGEQWNNIMKLINKAEKGSLDWTKQYVRCEDLKDQRGLTLGIFGATTGGPRDKKPSAPRIFMIYDYLRGTGARSPSTEGGIARIGVRGTMSGGILKITGSAKDFCAKIRALGKDALWREAIWRAFYDAHIQYSVEQAEERGLKSALVIGAFIDAAIDHGTKGGVNTLEGLLAKSGGSRNERNLLKSFLDKRSKIVDTDGYNKPPNGVNRVKQWRQLLDSGESDLKQADASIKKVTSWTRH